MTQSNSETPPVWLRQATAEPQQGDILLDFELITPRYNAEKAGWSLARTTADLAILTQSCDFQKPAQEEILVAAVYDYSRILEKWPQYRSSDYRKNLVSGQSVQDFLIPPLPGFRDHWMVVNFRNLFTVSKDKVIYTQRLELQSPYREALAQSYARFMMRVGLPQGLQGFDKVLPKAAGM